VNHEIEAIIKANYPLNRFIVPNEEAAKIYKEKGFLDKIALLAVPA
jgi:hypothetical protein